jgi:hypothetical protein
LIIIAAADTTPCCRKAFAFATYYFAAIDIIITLAITLPIPFSPLLIPLLRHAAAAF